MGQAIVERRGEGPPLVVVPGAAADATLWGEVAPLLESSFELHLVEVAGFARRPPAPGPLWPAIAEQLAAYVRPLGPSVWLMGHSWGGLVAWSLLADAGVPVRGAVIVDTMPALGELVASDHRALAIAVADRVARLRSVRRGQLAAFLEPSIRAMTRSPSQAERVLALAADTDPQTLAEAMEAAWLTDLRPRLRAAEGMGRPVRLVLPGDEHLPPSDRARKHALARAQIRELPHHRVVPVSRAGHYVMLDRPVALAAIVRGLAAL